MKIEGFKTFFLSHPDYEHLEFAPEIDWIDRYDEFDRLFICLRVRNRANAKTYICSATFRFSPNMGPLIFVESVQGTRFFSYYTTFSDLDAFFEDFIRSKELQIVFGGVKINDYRKRRTI